MSKFLTHFERLEKHGDYPLEVCFLLADDITDSAHDPGNHPTVRFYYLGTNESILGSEDVNIDPDVLGSQLVRVPVPDSDSFPAGIVSIKAILFFDRDPHPLSLNEPYFLVYNAGERYPIEVEFDIARDFSSTPTDGQIPISTNKINLSDTDYRGLKRYFKKKYPNSIDNLVTATRAFKNNFIENPDLDPNLNTVTIELERTQGYELSAPTSHEINISPMLWISAVTLIEQADGDTFMTVVLKRHAYSAFKDIDLLLDREIEGNDIGQIQLFNHFEDDSDTFLAFSFLISHQLNPEQAGRDVLLTLPQQNIYQLSGIQRNSTQQGNGVFMDGIKPSSFLAIIQKPNITIDDPDYLDLGNGTSLVTWVVRRTKMINNDPNSSPLNYYIYNYDTDQEDVFVSAFGANGGYDFDISNIIPNEEIPNVYLRIDPAENPDYRIIDLQKPV